MNYDYLCQLRNNHPAWRLLTLDNAPLIAGFLHHVFIRPNKRSIRQRELVTMAHASARTVVTVEKLYDGDLLADRTLAAGTLPGFYVEQVAVVERGGWPLPLPEHYAWDGEHLAEYAKLAASEDGFKRYLDRYVYERQAA